MKKKRPKVGLVLCGGIAKGLTHIGVLKVLEENKIKIDYISGTSIGAVIAGLYCSGMSPKKIEGAVLTTKWSSLFNFSAPKNYLIRKYSIRNYLKNLTGNKSFRSLKPRLFISATRLKDGKKAVLDKGSLVTAIMASISLPSIIKPEYVDGFEMVDGGLVDPLPIESLIDKCDKIIAVDVYREDIESPGTKTDSDLVRDFKEKLIKREILSFKAIFAGFKSIPALFRLIIVKIIDLIFTPALVLNLIAGRTPPEIAESMLKTYSIVMNSLSDLTLKCYKTDVLITPKSKNLGLFDFDRAKEFIEFGEKATKMKLFEIKKLLN